MKIKLELNLNEDVLKDEGIKLSNTQKEEQLTEMLFEVCEDWVLRNQQPDFEFIK